MTEKAKKNVDVEEETPAENTGKKPVAKAKVKEAKKPNIFKRGWTWLGNNWKPLLAGIGIGTAASVGTAYGVGAARAHKQRKESIMTDGTVE